MQKYNLRLGSHVKCNKINNYLLGAVEETIANNANALMVFTGPPQNARRVDMVNFFLDEYHQKRTEHGIEHCDVVVHAPYIINLANTVKTSTKEFGIDFLRKEIKRAEQMQASVIVLHPGSSVGGDVQQSLNQVADCLNQILTEEQTVKVALETMSGKGTEIGTSFEQLKIIIDQIRLKDKVGVCWDTCHLWDAGYDLSQNLEIIIQEFDQSIGLDKLLCIHLNDSKNNINAHRDRHANIGYGKIGFDTLLNIVYHPQLNNIVKILETPYVNDKAPYKEEIEMIKAKEFKDCFNGLVEE
ncbi:deoxyribonuclease IV [Spiroplasma endosymbiont of Amphibalanus improvisus]|uniref:deoxyribonuclease IV n=1 Tax=Spiroplasma endosymbiont of Amphibalanus improvisus TaxID=3066327 RepID=UPI00313AA638